MTTKLSRVISKENGKKWMVAVNQLEDFVVAASTKLNCPIEKVLLESADGFEISTNTELRLYLDGSPVPEFNISSSTFQLVDVTAVSPMPTENQLPTLLMDPVEKPECRFNVIDIIRNCGRPSSEIDPFLDRLMTKSNGAVLEETDRRKLVKILGTYLFAEFGTKVNPKPLTLHEMARSIVEYFPIAKCNDGNGWESFYDLNTNKGRLLKYTSRRRITTGVKRKYERKDKMPVSPDEDIEGAERLMRVSELTENNKDAMVAAFKLTFQIRRQWILHEKPLVFDILQRFPRLRDSLFTVKLDFHAITACEFDNFVLKWLEFEENVIPFLSTEVQEAITEAHDNLSKKTELVFLSLPELLPAPLIGRKMKDKDLPRVSSKLASQLYLQTFPENTVLDRALLEATRKNMSVGVIAIGHKLYLKLETEGISLNLASLPEAMACLSAIHFIFNFDYHPALKLVFLVFERLFGIPYKKGFVERNQKVCDFMTKVSKTM